MFNFSYSYLIGQALSSHSVNGKGLWIKLVGHVIFRYNVNCSYCDTRKKRKTSNYMSLPKDELITEVVNRELSDLDTARGLCKKDLVELLGERPDTPVLQAVKLSNANLAPMSMCHAEQGKLLVFDAATHAVWELVISVGNKGKLSATCNVKFNIPEAELSNSIICTPSETYISISVGRTSGLYRYKNETLECLVPNDSNTLVGGVAHLDDDSIIYTNMKKGQIMSVSQSTEVNVLSGKEQSAEAPLTSKDGLASNCTYAQCGPLLVLGKSVIVCDLASISIRIISDISALFSYHTTIQNLYEAFRVHSDKLGYCDQLAVEEIKDKLENICNFFEGRLAEVRAREENPNLRPDGSHGSLSYGTVEMFTDLKVNTADLIALIKGLNPEYPISSSALLSVPAEHHFSVMRSRYQMPSMLQYCQHLGTVLQETLKKLTCSDYVYFTSKSSFYPQPALQSIHLEFNPRPFRHSIPALREDERRLMLNWRRDFCQGIRNCKDWGTVDEC